MKEAKISFNEFKIKHKSILRDHLVNKLETDSISELRKNAIYHKIKIPYEIPKFKSEKKFQIEVQKFKNELSKLSSNLHESTIIRAVIYKIITEVNGLEWSEKFWKDNFKNFLFIIPWLPKEFVSKNKIEIFNILNLKNYSKKIAGSQLDHLFRTSLYVIDILLFKD